MKECYKYLEFQWRIRLALPVFLPSAFLFLTQNKVGGSGPHGPLPSVRHWISSARSRAQYKRINSPNILEFRTNVYCQSKATKY